MAVVKITLCEFITEEFMLVEKTKRKRKTEKRKRYRERKSGGGCWL